MFLNNKILYDVKVFFLDLVVLFNKKEVYLFWILNKYGNLFVFFFIILCLLEICFKVNKYFDKVYV